MESRLRCPREQTLHRKIGFLDPPVFFFFFSKQGKIAAVAFLEGSVKMGIKLPDYPRCGFSNGGTHENF